MSGGGIGVGAVVGSEVDRVGEDVVVTRSGGRDSNGDFSDGDGERGEPDGVSGEMTAVTAPDDAIIRAAVGLAGFVEADAGASDRRED